MNNQYIRSHMIKNDQSIDSERFWIPVLEDYLRDGGGEDINLRREIINLEILNDFNSPSRNYALLRIAAQKKKKKKNHADYFRSHIKSGDFYSFV